MPLNYPDILQHNNSSYPIIDSNNILGSVFVTGSDGEQYGISEYKRKLGMIVYFSSSQDFKYYKGGTTASADWSSPLSWSMFGGGATYLEGPGIIIDGNNYISASLGDGLEFDGNSKIQATVRTVNLQGPTNGNISLSITNTITGLSSSLSGSPFFLPDTYSPRPPISGTIFVVSGEVGPNVNKNGEAYIFVTSSAQAGSWQQIFGFNEATADLRYVRLSSDTTQDISSSLTITGSSVTFSSSLYWPITESMTGGGAANTLVWDPATSQIKTTGSYGGGGGTGTNEIKAGSVGPLSFQNNPLTASVIFNTVMADTNYGVSIMGGDARSWTIDNKTIDGFIINTNSSVALTTSASWIAAPSNNP